MRCASLLASAGITIEFEDREYVLTLALPLSERRRLLAKASRALNFGEKSDNLFVEEVLSAIAPSARNLRNKASRSIGTVKPTRLDFTGLMKFNGRWQIAADPIDWAAVRSGLAREGVTLSDDESVPSQDLGSYPLVNDQRIPGVVQLRANMGVRAIGAGTAELHPAALRSALGEAVERIESMSGHTKQIFINSADHIRENNIIIPNIHRTSRDGYTSELAIDWVLAQTLGGFSAAIPAELAFFEYRPQSRFRGFSLQHTAGLAAGASLEEAVWVALCECMERDAYWIIMRCGLRCPDVSIDVLSQQSPKIAEAIAAAGIKIVLKDISLDWPISIVHALVIDETHRLPAFSHGIGSGTSIADAVKRAVFEALGVREALIEVSKLSFSTIVRPLESQSTARRAWCNPSFGQEIDHLIAAEAEDCAIPAFSKGNVHPADLVPYIEEVGGRVFWVKLGERSGLQVVRVIVEQAIRPDHLIENIPNRLQVWMRRSGRSSISRTSILT